MRRIKKINSIIFLLLFVALNSCSYIEENKKTGNIIIEKLELYKSANSRLPDSLQEIGQDEIVNGVLFCYKRIDSFNYMVWFGTTLGEGIYYYSDTKQWESKWRRIGVMDTDTDSGGEIQIQSPQRNKIITIP